jgi:hypothetical protein
MQRKDTDEEMRDDQVMMSVGPPLTIDTSGINLSYNESEILRMIQQYL